MSDNFFVNFCEGAERADIVVKSVKSELNVFIPINKFSILLIQHLTIKFPRKKN